MPIRPTVLAVLTAACLFACGGAKEEAKAPESDPWADYKGTYATAGGGSRSSAAKSDDQAKPQAKSKAADKTVEKSADKDEGALPPSPAPAGKRASRGTIGGESVSSISPETLADVTKTKFKTKVVSSKVVVGPQYEQVQIQTKSGTTIQIIRPASSPAADGPPIGSPKAKNDALGKTDSGWYDEDADVLVVVSSAKKGGAQKVLGTLIKK